MDIDSSHLPLVKEFQARHRAGLMTLVFTDLAGSTKLKNDLGDALAGAILSKHHSCVRELLRTFAEAREISTAGDSFFIIFDSPSSAVLFSIQLHKRLRILSNEVGQAIRDRIGIHVGEVFVEQGQAEGKVQNFSGIQVDTCARVMSLCDPERTLLTRFAFDNAQQTLKGRTDAAGRLIWINHGLFEVKGVAQPLEICEVAEPSKTQTKPLEDSEKAKRFLRAPATIGPESALDRVEGWRGVVARRRREVLVSIGAAWVAVLIVISFLISTFDGISYDFAYNFKKFVAPTEAVIVYMDQESHDQLKQPDTAPWDHAVHARLVERLTQSDAKAVVFDILFTSNQPTTPALVKACDENGNVFLPILEKGPTNDITMVKPLEELRKVARSSGVVESNSKTAKARFQIGLRGDVKEPVLAEMVAERMVPGSVARTKGRWLNYYGPSGTIKHVSFFQALSTNDVPDSIFRDKAVFIGAMPQEAYTGGRGTNDYVRAYDEFPTPFGKMPGVELNATAALNLMRGESLEKISAVFELGIYLGAAVVLAILFSFLPTRSAVLCGAVIAFGVAVVSGWMVWRTNQWFCWSVISLVEIPVIILCCVATRTDKLGRQKKELEQTLAAQQSEFLSKASQLHTQAISNVAAVGASNKPSIPDHELFTPIGKGAYGEVWLGIDLTNSFRAIKIIRAKNFRSDRPFDREFDGIKRFAPISRAHPGLVDILHVGKNEEMEWFFYIMEAADDIVGRRQIDPGRYRPKTLASLLEGNRPLAPAEFLTMAIHLCEGLAFLHSKGLLHRDLKPANVLYMYGKPQLADPGLVAGAETGDSEITMMGTVGYMAPDKTASPASDIYSLGKVFYQAAFGRPVAAFPELPTFLIDSDNHEFFTGLNDIILKACAQNPRERHASVAELRLELESLGETARIFKPS